MLLMSLSILWNIRKAYSSPGQRLLFEERMIVISPGALKVETSCGMTTSYPWTMILKEEWRRELLLLYITSTTFIIIPMSVLDEASEGLIKRYLGRAKEAKGILPPPRVG